MQNAPHTRKPASDAPYGASHSAPGGALLAAPTPFDAVFDSSAEALLIVDLKGGIQRANSRARDLLYLPAAKPPLSLGDFLPGPSAEQLPYFLKAPDTRRKIETSLSTGLPVRITLRSILPGAGHLLLCVEEGPLARRADVKWRQADAELRSLLESLEAAVILYDTAGRVRSSSLGFAEMFGLESGETAKIARFEELEELLALRFRSPASFSKPLRAFLRGTVERTHDDLHLTGPPSRSIERFSRSVLDAQGRSIGWLEIFTDVTAKRQIHSKMLQTEKMAALGRLVSGIAHELNNPLTAILGYAQLLLGHGLSETQLAEAIKVQREAERARRIVKNLLYFARENKPERVRARINEIVERTLALRSYELKVENILVECDLAPDLPETMADPYQLQQVVLNLVVNAEQALLANRGHGRILVRTSHNPGESLHSRGRILLEVSDDGPGIPQDLLSRIFDPFFTTKPLGIGTGLGLSIVYGIVHEHQGEIGVENLPRGGAKFAVEIPVSEVAASTALPVPKAAPGYAGPKGRILAIEDEPTVAQLIVDVLGEEGHAVEATLDSQDGLTRLSRAAYDLIICDLRMPRLDGRAFFESLVRTGSPMRHRILFITGDTLAPRTLEFLEGNHLPYLVKPFLVEELKLAVHGLLAARAGSEETARPAPDKSLAAEWGK